MDYVPYSATEAEYLHALDVRMEQTNAAIEFVKSKGPFPQGELVLLAGNFNVDANLLSPNKSGSGINEKLAAPEANLLIAARKAEVEGEYTALLFALGGQGTFNVLNTNFLKANMLTPTYGACTFVEGLWVPTETFFTDAADQCTNQVADYIFQLDPKGAMLAPRLTKKKLKTKINYKASANPAFTAPENA
jgi:hypothetical protein